MLMPKALDISIKHYWLKSALRATRMSLRQMRSETPKRIETRFAFALQDIAGPHHPRVAGRKTPRIFGVE